MTADWSLTPRTARRLLAALTPLVLVTGCGGSGSTHIPQPTPTRATPLATPLQLAPGVTVLPSQLTVPPYTLSTLHPPPAGTPVRKVMLNLVEDNYVENVAIERGDPALLQFADTGPRLLAEKEEISANRRNGTKVVSIRDFIISAKVGSEPDPSAPTVRMAVIVTGTELRTQRTSSGTTTSSAPFQVIVWLQRVGQRFLLVELGRP